ncbi:glutamyl-tRNA(Gln) amidotransferase subunit C, mitochondrial-like [Paramacrobiotus metropolitanus]|uniref:glutamyl-tRNA(Gln) amidotransferase subunit C, mitochondrial-like n=1 Tax=Paramacrobiotus metropolitanus TaxID=2943436 RepID=UPI00244612E5|nr:glutamyl-tRNA(Gln) amidotransferase subunit C, mitochondrial-like [Paramacrobiotus metropolitanus]
MFLSHAGSRGVTAPKALWRFRSCQKRTKFSDSFKEIYAWKNMRNRPTAQSEGNLQVEAKAAELTLDTVYHLEQLSLVNFSNQAAIERLASAIRYANRLRDVDISGVKPLYSLLENETLDLRPDEITEGNQREDVLRNAKITMEHYYLAPPGNIPVEQTHKYDPLQLSSPVPGAEDSEQKGESSVRRPAATSVEMKKVRRKA